MIRSVENRGKVSKEGKEKLNLFQTSVVMLHCACFKYLINSVASPPKHLLRSLLGLILADRIA